MSTEPGSDPIGDFQRWLMKAGARSLGRDVAGRVRAAGLDVLRTEPPGPDSLASLPGVVVTPHAAWYSEESEVQLRTTVATIVRDALLSQ